MITVKFHKTLQKYTNVDGHNFNVDSFSSLLLGIKHLFPELENFFKVHNTFEFAVLIYDNKIIPDSWAAKDRIPDHVQEINLVPSICGSGSRVGKILLGVAIAAFAFVALPALAGAQGALGSFAAFSNLVNAGGFLGFAAKGLLGLGINLIIGALLQQELEAPKLEQPTVDDDRRNNDIFDGLVNSVDSSQIVPLTYGHNRVAGQFISGFSTSLRHGKEDIISVIDQFDSDTAGDVRLRFRPEWKQDVSSVEWSPNSRFTYKVPEPKGTQPLDYTANNLPSFATFNPDANVRTISGRAPSSGRGRIEITANNSLGYSVFTLRWNVYDYQWDDQGSSGDFGEDDDSGF